MIKYLLFLLVICVPVVSKAQTYVFVPGDTSGYTAGDFTVSDGGAAIYNVPIDVVTGTAGFQPHLSFTYSSQGSNGIMGAGLSLEGLPVISRAEQTRAQDGNVQGITFTNSDRFAINGERLVRVDTTQAYGATGTEYRSEQNTFSKIIVSGTSASPNSFTVYSKDGLIYEFGSTTNNARSVISNGAIIHWLVNKISDRFGNYCTIDYYQNVQTGEYYPTEIKYGGNSVTGQLSFASLKFEYEARTDSVQRYISGYKITSCTKRLKAIRSYINTNTAPLISYEFTYQYSPSGISQLVLFRQCGKNGSCRTPTTFSWSNTGAPLFTAGSLSNIQQGATANKLLTADLNSDGVQDILKVPQIGNVVAFISNKSTATPAFDSTIINPAITLYVNDRVVLGDFNGDGKQDFLVYDSATGANSIRLNTTMSGGTQIACNWITSPVPTALLKNNVIIAADFNADGRTDLLCIDPANGNNYWLFSNTVGYAGVTFELNGSLNYYTNLFNVNVLSGVYQPFFADFNGDGMVDLFIRHPSTGANAFFKNNGGIIPSFTYVNDPIAASLLANPSAKLFIPDMTGDGLPDLMSYVPSTGQNIWWVNTGNFYFSPLPTNLSTTLASQIAGGDALLHIDYNADGFTDMIWTNKANGVNRWFSNDGKMNFSQTNNVIATTDLVGYDLQGIGNFSSKSSFDFFLYNNAANIKAKMLKGATGLNNLITRITPGNGEYREIAYDLLTSDSVYNKNDSAIYPLMDYQATQYVVSNVKVPDGIGGKRATSYHYSGAKIHLAGRGFRGFSQIDEIDEALNMVSTRIFLSGPESWKNISSPVSKNIRKMANGTVISVTDIENGIKSYYGGKCNFSFIKSSSSKTYETNGAFVDSLRTTQEHDDYGNVISTVTKYGAGMQDSLVNVTYNNPTTWVLGRNVASHLYRTSGSQPVIVKASGFVYDSTAGTGVLLREDIEPDSGNTVKITKTYERNDYGNIVKSTETGWKGTALESHVTRTTYSSFNRFADSVINPLGQVSTYTYDSAYGSVLKVKNANGLTTQYAYDNYNRLVKTTYADGSWTTLDYRKCGNGQSCPLYGSHLIYQQSSKDPPVVTYYDTLNRVIRTATKGFNGTMKYVDNFYDHKGLLVQQTAPYYAGNTPVSTYFFYDPIGRTVRVVSPGNRVDSIKYAGRTTTYINALGQKRVIVKDAKEQVILSRDNQNNDVAYQYDPAGRLIQITDPVGNTIKMSYNIHGHLTKLDDPDLGVRTYVTNSFGEMISSTRGPQTTNYKYDSLGRIRQRTEPEGTLNYYYDSQPFGKGMLDSVTGYNYYKETYLYDSFSRITTQVKRIDSQLYTQSFTYDNQSRVLTTTDPTGFSITNLYNANGYLRAVARTNTTDTFWKAITINAKDQVELQQYGNGLQVVKSYDPNTDYLTAIETKKGGSYLQRMTFNFDVIGNCTQRKDLLQNKTEDFWLDNINRLIKSQVQGGDSVLMTYNAIGNILSKSDVGVYTYGGVNSGPHQLLSVALTTTQCIPSLQVNTQVNSFDKVREITRDSTRADITYSPDHQRCLAKMYDSSRLIRIKVYVSPVFEKEIKGGDTIITHFIKSPEGIIGVYTTHSIAGHPAALQYYHRDHLGTTVLVTGDTGIVVARFSHDPWGRRRNADWSTTLTDTSALAADRGFTGHEHYDLFELIDMNGRIYDPVLGRFASADPVIQDPTNLQCLNRFSYCNNNPLSFTDPSGYSWKHPFKHIGHWFEKGAKIIAGGLAAATKLVAENWRTIATAVVGITIGAFTLGAGSGILLSGAASGFASSTTGTLLAGGNLGDALKAGIRGGVISGISAVATFGIGEAFGHATDASNIFQKSVAHGVVQGTANVANGGKFIHGFYAGAAASAASPFTAKIDSYAGRIAAASVVGGTVSELSGGNFANGAVNAAFIQMYNEEVVKLYQDYSASFNGKLSKASASYGLDGKDVCYGGFDGLGVQGCAGTSGIVGQIGGGYALRLNKIINLGVSGGGTMTFNFDYIRIGLFANWNVTPSDIHWEGGVEIKTPKIISDNKNLINELLD